MASRVDAHPDVGGHGDFEQATHHAPLGGVVHGRHAPVPQPERGGDPRFRHHRHLLEQRVCLPNDLGAHAGREAIGERRGEQRGRLDRRALRDHYPVAGASHGGCHERIVRAKCHARGATHHRPGTTVVSRRVSGHDRDPQVVARAREGVPERCQVVVADLGRQVQVHRHPAEREPAGGGVRRQDVHGEPRRALPAVRGDHEHRIGRDGHRDAGRDLHHSDVDPVLRPDQHVGVRRAQAPQDHLLEQLRRRLARPLLAHRAAP